jgi:hypothetical protein
MTMRRARSTRRTERSRGQAMLEFTLVTPIILVLLVGVFEAARFIFYYEALNHATRAGARYAIVHGANSACPSGPPPPARVNTCDPTGAKVKEAVQQASLQLADVGSLFVFDPVWTSRGSLSPPSPGDTSSGHNGRGEYVTVFVDFTYDPVIREIVGVPLLPTITIRAESTLVVNF